MPFGRYGWQCMSVLMGLVTLTFDLLTLKLVCQSHQRLGIFVPNLGTLGLRVLELFAMYATDGRTDGRSDGWTKATLNAPFPTGGEHNNRLIYIDMRIKYRAVANCHSHVLYNGRNTICIYYLAWTACFQTVKQWALYSTTKCRSRACIRSWRHGRGERVLPVCGYVVWLLAGN